MSAESDNATVRAIDSDLAETNRYADLFVARGLTALFLRELIRLRTPTDAELLEWKDFAIANIGAGGGLIGRPISGELADVAKNRAIETISTHFLKSLS